jgi:hypothetical protein
MDWTGYPKEPVTHDTVIETTTTLAVFLGLDPIEGAAIIDLIDQAAPLPYAVDGLAVPYTREVVAWRAWMTNQRTGTAAALLDTLSTIPDPQQPEPGEAQLVPVLLDRLQIANVGEAFSNVAVRYRTSPAEPMRMFTFTSEAASVEFDSTLLGDPSGACVTVRLTVPEAGPDA